MAPRSSQKSPRKLPDAIQMLPDVTLGPRGCPMSKFHGFGVPREVPELEKACKSMVLSSEIKVSLSGGRVRRRRADRLRQRGPVVVTPAFWP